MVPNKIPNLIQILFRGFKIVEFNKPKIKKIIARTIAQILILPSFNNGNNDIIKKNTKKTIPKLLFEDICNLSLFIILDINKNIIINLKLFFMFIIFKFLKLV
jgi:hypothetical protein